MTSAARRNAFDDEDAYEMVSSTTAMLRALNLKLEDVRRNASGGTTLSKNSLDEVQRMIDEGAAHIEDYFTENKATTTRDAVIAAIKSQTERWERHLDDATAAAKAQYAKLLAKLEAIERKPRSPETANPLRRFTDDGVIETIARDRRLFFPYAASSAAEAPRGTCVLRDTATMAPVTVSARFAELVALPRDDPNRALMAHPLVPVGDIPSLRAVSTLDRLRLLTMADDADDLPPNVWHQFAGSFNTQYPLSNDAEHSAVARRAAVTPSYASTDTRSATYFNATLLLLYGYGIWPVDKPAADAYVPYRDLVRGVGPVEGVAAITPETYVYFLWRCAAAWNTRHGGGT